MAVLGQWSGGVIGSLQPGTTWAAPNALFPTQDRNDSSVYTFASSTSTLTLPSSGLADGYLVVAAYHFEDSSNGRHNPQGRFQQTGGTGTFVQGQAGGYSRDNSEDRAYVRCWGFVDNPSASATIQFQWRRDTNGPNATDGTVRSVLQVIPLYYEDAGLYSSTTAGNYGGTTPNLTTGWSGTDGTDITLATNQVTIASSTGKRYLCIGSYFMEDHTGGTRTQRWMGFREGGTLQRHAMSHAFYRDASNDQNGNIFTHLLETAGSSITIDVAAYRGDGVSALQGGADSDGVGTEANAQLAMVVLELPSSAEVFRSRETTGGTDIANNGTTDVNIVRTLDFNDSASFTKASNTAINAEQAMDVLAGGHINSASNAPTDGSRFTCQGYITVNGTEQNASEHGNYGRGNQSSTDCFGQSASLLSFHALSSGDDLGASTVVLPGTEAASDDWQINAGWAGFWGINLDTLTSGTAYQKELTETVSLSDSTAKSTSRELTETVALVDSVAKAASKTLTDVLALADSATRAAQKVLTDTVVLADKTLKVSGIVLAAGPNLGDDITTDLTATIQKELTETVALSDTVERTTSIELTESVALADSFEGQQTGKALTDAVALGDALERSTSRALVEAIALADSVEVQSARTLSESLGLADTVETVYVGTRTLSDAVALVDSAAKSTARALAEQAQLADSVSATLSTELVETLSLGDGLVRDVSTARAETLTLGDVAEKGAGKVLSDAVTLADDLTTDLGNQLELTETLGLSDTVETVWTAARTLSETVVLADKSLKVTQVEITQELRLADDIETDHTTGGPITKELTETLSLDDSREGAWTAARELTESVTLVDSVVTARTAELTETLTLTDLDMVPGRAFEEAVTLTDTATKDVAVELTETVTLSDGVETATNQKMLTESVSLADSVERTLTAARTLSDSVVLADSRSTAISVELTETLSLADTRERTWTASRTLTDAFTLADTVQSFGMISIGEVIVLGDAVETTGTFGKEATEAVGLTDSLSFVLQRQLAETVTLTDTRTSGRVQTLSETVTLTDTQDRLPSTFRLGETVVLADEIVTDVDVGLVLSETLTLTDSYSRVLGDYVKERVALWVG